MTRRETLLAPRAEIIKENTVERRNTPDHVTLHARTGRAERGRDQPERSEGVTSRARVAGFRIPPVARVFSYWKLEKSH